MLGHGDHDYNRGRAAAGLPRFPDAQRDGLDAHFDSIDFAFDAAGAFNRRVPITTAPRQTVTGGAPEEPC